MLIYYALANFWALFFSFFILRYYCLSLIYFNYWSSSWDLSSSACLLAEILLNKHCPTRIKHNPGTTNTYPTIVKFPGNFWTPEKSKIKVAMNGYKVIAKAGIIGSGNILVIKTKDTICPRESIIAIYIKPVKCKFEKRLHIPQKGS